MIQDPSKEVTLIVYNTPAPPKYIKVNKRLIRYILMIVPALIIFFLAGSLFYSIFLKNKVSELKALEPAILQQLDEQEIAFNAQLKDLKKTNEELTRKLSRGGTTNEGTASLLSLFTIPLGSQDLRGQNMVTLSDIKVTTEKKQIKLNFNMLNNTENKLTGYMSVVQYQGPHLQFYPPEELNEKNLKLQYASGEYYSFSRLRPSPVTFEKISSLSSRYKIYLFSKTGDLIFYQQIGPFNIE